MLQHSSFFLCREWSCGIQNMKLIVSHPPLSKSKIVSDYFLKIYWVLMIYRYWNERKKKTEYDVEFSNFRIYVGPNHISKSVGKNHQWTTKLTLKKPAITSKIGKSLEAHWATTVFVCKTNKLRNNFYLIQVFHEKGYSQNYSFYFRYWHCISCWRGLRQLFQTGESARVVCGIRSKLGFIMTFWSDHFQVSDFFALVGSASRVETTLWSNLDQNRKITISITAWISH